MRKTFLTSSWALVFLVGAGCTQEMEVVADARADASGLADRTTDVVDVLAALDASAPMDVPTDRCANVRCNNAGEVCVNGVCARDCRVNNATACAMGEVCDFVDGLCRAPSQCTVSGTFALCNEGQFCISVMW